MLTIKPLLLFYGMPYLIIVMRSHTVFESLSTIVGEQTSRGRSVRNVEAATNGSTLRASMEVLVPLDAGSSDDQTGRGPAVDSTSLTDEGTLAVELAVPELVPLPPSAETTVAVSGRTVEVTPEGLLVALDLTIDPSGSEPPEPTGPGVTDGADDDADGSGIGPARRDDALNEDASDDDPAEGLEAIRDDSIPPYEDAEYLRAIYARCDTFAEMRDEIEMDVSAETVRRYMIDAGIHEPTDYETATDRTENGHRADDGAAEREESPGDPPSDGDSRPPLPDAQLVADGIGLPDGVELADVIEVVVRSSTVYEVKRELGLNEGYARELLKQLDLLDLVMCRMSRAPDREVTFEEAARRVRQCAVTTC